MTLSLGKFQQAFIKALYRHEAPQLAALTAQPGFQVYRNTILKGCVDALCANFPTVERLVGCEWLAAAARVHADHTPPADGRLIYYGAAFADFLETFEPARQMPYLAEVARLDYLWLEAFAAFDEPSLALAELAGMTAADLARCGLRPRGNVRWRWFAGQPIYSLWRYNREALVLPDSLPWQGEGVLLVGGTEGVAWQQLEPGACVFLDACAAGHDLASASALALAAQADLDFNVLLGRLLAARVFAPLALPH
ncbi:DNA-binding domain-containing protein [Pseudomonas sp. RIT-PI-S]|uniref:HvfC/BufC N-terminal domain-containing protein n=1 Tax=Pseudomonas sp. RIT-PI-S TaxID=3035295 RepID=UPI0021D88A04|nr:DNA-binding domain-containing protein [Pseudomonas sp. RIT-PI-S]